MARNNLLESIYFKLCFSDWHQDADDTRDPEPLISNTIDER